MLKFIPETLMKYFYLIFCFAALFCSCKEKREKMGEDIYSKVIQYQKAHGHLPDNLKEIGIEDKEEGPIYYHRQTDSTFHIYYGGGLGESVIYDPKTDTWNSDH